MIILEYMEYIRSRQTELMLTTRRVGDESEDPSMKRARRALSEINRIGLITIDSQMGVKRDRHWQRAYVWGLATRETATKIKAALSTVDSILVLAFPHSETSPFTKAYIEYSLQHMPRLDLTLEGPGLHAVTRQPIGVPATFSEMWTGLLPELHAEMARDMSPAKIQRLKETCKRDSLQVFVMDTVWGRPSWLFKTVISAGEAIKLVASESKGR